MAPARRGYRPLTSRAFSDSQAVRRLSHDGRCAPSLQGCWQAGDHYTPARAPPVGGGEEKVKDPSFQ